MMGGLKILYIGLLVAVAILGVLLGLLFIKTTADDITELKQVHMVFYHGERTPKKSEVDIFPLSDQSNEVYYPHGFEALTNQGKMTMFKLGQTIRKHYNGFLPILYEPNSANMQAVDTDISKMSALLVLAGLWPIDGTKQSMWNKLAWQPIPYTNVEAENDNMLYENNCVRYVKERERVLRDYNKNMPKIHKEIYENLTLLTGNNALEFTQINKLVNLFTIQEKMKMVIPEWLNNIKEILEDIVQVNYILMFKNTLLRKLSGGSILQKIINDSKQNIMQKNNSHIPKIMMYSGYSNNIAAILAATEALTPHSPDFGAAVIFELHYRPTTEDYIFKVFYLKNATGEMTLVKLPECEGNCPFEEFEDNLNDVLVENYLEECKPV